MFRALQLVGVAAVPLNVTVLAPCVAPKVVPVIVIDAPTAPEAGLTVVIAGVTVKPTPLLGSPPTVTTTLPLVAPAGTGTTMLVALQLVGVAAVPPNVTVLVPCVAPKVVPVIVTGVPTGPAVGVRRVIDGGTVTVNATPLLGKPPTVTTTGPVVAPAGTGTTMLVALQLVGVAAVPLNVTVLEPCVAPKFEPVIVTGVPTGPEIRFSPVIAGATEKLTPLLGNPVTVTTTFPLVAPAGTGTTMLVGLQLVGVAAVPLTVTVLDPCVAPKFVPVMVTGVPIDPPVGFSDVIVGVLDASGTTVEVLEYSLRFPAASVARTR